MLLLPTDVCSLKRPENKGVNMKKVKISIYKDRLLAVNAPPWIGVYLAVSTTGVCRVCQWLPLTASLAPFQDMIHIADTKVARRYGDFFIRQIHKFEEVRGVESGVGAAGGGNGVGSF